MEYILTAHTKKVNVSSNGNVLFDNFDRNSSLRNDRNMWQNISKLNIFTKESQNIVTKSKFYSHIWVNQYRNGNCDYFYDNNFERI